MSVKLKNSKLITQVLCLLIVTLIILPYSLPSAQADGSDTIASAKNTLNMCYTHAKEAEATGANITRLQETLNDAGLLLSKAELANAQNDIASATNYANQAQSMLSDFVYRANAIVDTTSHQQQTAFLYNIVGLIVGAFVIIGSSVVLWIYLTKKASNKQLSIKRFKVLFFVVPLILMLLVASPVLQHFFVLPQNDRFTEFWILGPEQRAENYPHDIVKNAEYQVFLGIHNNLGSVGYYMVQVKLLDPSIAGPDTFKRTSSSMPALYNFNVFVAAEQNVQLPMDFSFDYSLIDFECYFNSLILGDEKINLEGYSSMQDSISGEYYGYLVFELWLYEDSINQFLYHERYLSVRLNMTATS